MVQSTQATTRRAKKQNETGQALREFDAAYLNRPGVALLAGIDEAGRGALAGPVVAAVVVCDSKSRFDGLNDSKQLSEARREALYPVICRQARAVAIGWATAREIDRINVLAATLLAARRALEVLAARPDLILTDYLRLAGTPQPVEPLVKGDARSQAIAAASVVAKVARDRWMRALDAEYPDYGFAAHKGYGARAHLEALARVGSSTLHRHSFRGVDCFETEYRRSASLERLLQEIEAGTLDPAESESIWLGRGYRLPECERETFDAAMQRRASSQG